LWIVLDYEQPGLSPPRTRGSRRWLLQRAWLDGTVLVVERGQAVRQPGGLAVVRTGLAGPDVS